MMKYGSHQQDISHLVNFDALTVKAAKQTFIEHEQKKGKKS